MENKISNPQTDNIISDLIAGIKTRKSRFIVIIPTYNEIENITELIERLVRDVLPPIEILVVDDNSPDGTADATNTLKMNIPNLHILRRPEKEGLGAAYLAGYKLGIGAGFDYIITMDADLSHDPEIINEMANEIKTCDVVIGSRFVRGGGIVDIQVSRILISKLGNLVTDNLLEMPFHDCTSGFRCYHTSVLASFDLEKEIKARKYVFLVELLFLLFHSGYRIKEIPIIFINRLKGKTKVNFGEMVHALKIIFALSVKSLLKKIGL